MSHKRKNLREKKQRMPVADINIVPLMDALTTMLFFLLSFYGLANFAIMKGSALTQASSSGEAKPTFTLEVMLLSESSAKIWLGPTAELKMADKGNQESILRKNFSGDPKTGFSKRLLASDAKNLFAQVQKSLIPIRRAFPQETRVVLTVADGVKYQTMIDGLAAVRSLGSSENGFELQNLLGKTEKTKVLFPEVIIGEHQGGTDGT